MIELRLEQTCMACPEQYDVFDKDGTQVGYLRLRHGWFRADYIPKPLTFEERMACGFSDRTTVYVANPKGDGIFDDDERDHYIGEALSAIRAAMVIQAFADQPREPAND